jgi:hypothetical protein
LDSLTRKPIPYVNVFFANTTIGTITDTTGTFTIKNIPSGKYDLTVSFVGYETVQAPLDFSGADQRVTVYLAEEVIRLQEVYVRADTSNWKGNFDQFKWFFLGATQNAAKTVITNPRNVKLYFDKSDRLLTARAKQDIQIENRALGYKIHYQLLEFMVDYAADRMVYFGIPRFEELSPKGNGELKRWTEQRKRAYHGSFNHFIKSLRQNTLEQNGFDVRTFYRVPNRNRPPDELLSERINYWRGRSVYSNGIVYTEGKNDSLSYYQRLRALPKMIDSVGYKITDTRELFVKGSDELINYKGMLQVMYKNEGEEIAYASRRKPMKVQLSVINFTSDQLRIYDNGYCEDIHSIFLEGYIGWSEKLSELLPLEYVPDEN